MRSSIVLLMTIFALAACQEDSADLPIAAEGACGALEWADLIGESRDVLETANLPDQVRIIGPDDLVTTDFIAERLNISYDEDGVITSIECG